ncbi:MAG: VOC family protein [Cyanobacteriota bacterium]|nr:VOC family protein [Cyanobacteriota bacterium]
MIESLDHLVLTVSNLRATLDFYTHVMGMEVITFGQEQGEGRKALRFGQQKMNLHEQGKEWDPKAAHPLPGSADLCFITQQPLSSVMADLERKGVAVLLGPVMRTGAMGVMGSIYFRDPDGNLIELANYSHGG